MAQSHRFWNWIARRYARASVADVASYEEKLRRTRARLEPHFKVLEFGCGTGTTALHHAPFVAEIRGVDASPKMIEICREKAEADGAENVRFDVASIEDLDQPPVSLDAVLGMSILHLVDDHRAVIASVYEMLRPGGLFFSSTICLEGRAKFLRGVVLPAGHAIGILPRIHALSRDGLVRDMEQAGFVIEDNWQPGDDPGKAVFLIARKPG